jgi:hypothetical protein
MGMISSCSSFHHAPPSSPSFSYYSALAAARISLMCTWYRATSQTYFQVPTVSLFRLPLFGLPLFGSRFAFIAWFAVALAHTHRKIG